MKKTAAEILAPYGINKGRKDVVVLWEDALKCMEDYKAQEATTHYHVADNSIAFREWLNFKKIEFIPNGHFTSIPLQGIDIFKIAMEFGVYKYYSQQKKQA